MRPGVRKDFRGVLFLESFSAAQGLMALLLFSIAGVFVPKPAAPPGSVVDCSHDTAGVADSNAVCRN